MGTPAPNPCKDWLSDKGWADACCLDGLDRNFRGLMDSLADRPDQWREVLDTAEPHTSSLPHPFNDMLNSFQKLLVLRCLAQDKLIPAIQVECPAADAVT
jgi:dynein heavy chain, axonemal